MPQQEQEQEKQIQLVEEKQLTTEEKIDEVYRAVKNCEAAILSIQESVAPTLEKLKGTMAGKLLGLG